MKTKIIILFSRPWSMTDETTGETRSGVSLQYCLTDSFAPNEDDDLKGYMVTKESITPECAAGITQVPGLYECELGMKAQSGKNVLYVSGGLKLISTLQK